MASLHGYIRIWVLLSSFLLLVNAPNRVDAYNQAEAYALIDHLFATYKPEVRPTSTGNATFVYVGLYLLNINLDEKEQILKSTVLLDCEWSDEYLSWAPSSYGNIERFYYPQKKVWLPDIVVENSVMTQDKMSYDENLVSISYNGTITWVPSEVIKTSCDVDVTYYPFDTQTCKIILSTWLSTKSEIDVSPDNETPFMLDRYSQSGTWELLETSFADLPNSGELTRMEFSLTIRRLRGYYVVNIILPVVFLSFTASAVFFLPAEAGEKMGMSITVLLAYAVYLTIIADNMPQTSLQLSLLAVYLTMQLGATAIGVIMSTIVLHIHHKHEERKIGKRTKQYTRKLRNLFGINRKKKKADTTATSNTDREFTRTTSLSLAPLDTKHTPTLRGIRVTPYEEKANVKEKKCLSDDDDDGEEITWPKVAETLDRLIFVIMSIYIALTTLVTTPVLAIGGLFY